MVKVEVVYISPKTTFHVSLQVQVGTKISEVLARCSLFEIYPEAKECAVGVFGRRVSTETPVKDGDRIEIYRPLLCDPKEKRRQRAKGRLTK